MSISLPPIRISLWGKPTGKRREDDAIDLLQCKLIGARLLIKGLRLQLDDQDRAHAATVRRIDERHGEVVRGLEQQIAEMQRKLDVACKAETAVAITQPIPVITPVMPLHEAPFATTNPGRVPCSWGVKDDEPEPAT